MGKLLQDVRYGLRVLLKKPGFTVVAVVTLALGTGVSTALCTVFDAFALRPLPLSAPHKLVHVFGRAERGTRQNLFSYLDYLDYRDRNHTLARSGGDLSGARSLRGLLHPCAARDPCRSDGGAALRMK